MDAAPPGVERWLRRLAGVLVVVALLVALPLGCTTVVRAPEQVAEPTVVYILDHGRTPTLVLPAWDEGFTRWAYGDWRYYAEGRANVSTGAAALLWPTQGALGRMEHAGPATPAGIEAQVDVSIDEMHAVRVERDAVRRLRAELERAHREQAATRVENPAAGLAFVNDERRYTLLNNSNHAVADWLRTLGCDVGVVSPVSRWRVER